MKVAQIKTNIWLDDWFPELENDEKVMWIYLLSNDECNIAGIYKVTPKNINRMTNIPISRIKEILRKFEEDEKAYYHKSYIILPNRVKYNARSPKIVTGTMEIIDSLPDSVLKYILKMEDTRLYTFLRNNQRSSENPLIRKISPKNPDRVYSKKNRVYSEKDTLSHSILSYPIQSNSTSSNAKMQIDDDDDSEKSKNQEPPDLIETAISEYGFGVKDKKQIREIAKTESGRVKIINIIKKAELDDNIENKAGYVIKALKNSVLGDSGKDVMNMVSGLAKSKRMKK